MQSAIIATRCCKPLRHGPYSLQGENFEHGQSRQRQRDTLERFLLKFTTRQRRHNTAHSFIDLQWRRQHSFPVDYNE
jgi:hypothetical protein